MAVQTGKFHVYEIKDDKRVVSAIANATLYFLDVNDQEQFKLTTKTDNEGNFNFDLALGEYVVLATAGDGLEQVLANGSTFLLTTQSAQSAFEEWLNNPSENADSSLLAKFRELMQRTESAAERGEQAAVTVDQKKTTSLTEINTAKTNAVNAVNTTKNSSVQAVTDTKTDAISEVNATKDTAIEELEAKVPDFTADLNKKWDVQQTIGDGKILRESEAQKIRSINVNTNEKSVFSKGLPAGYYDKSNVAGSSPLNRPGNFIKLVNGADRNVILFTSMTDEVGNNTIPQLYLFSNTNGAWLINVEVLTDANTRIDSNGFIKRASPIIDLYANHIEHNDQFDEEPIFEKIGIGHYKISNTLGLAKGLEAGDWYIETPKDKNGERYFNTEWQQLEDNTVIIRTYEREAFTEEYERYDENGNVLKDPNGNPLKFYKRHEINGEPTDIIENRFISLRFYEEPKEHEAPEMPEESEEDRKAREEQQTIEAREQEIAELKRNRTLKSNEALVMKDIDESVYLELIEEVKEINARLKSFS